MRVLVVDDDEAARQTARKMLTDAGHSAATASNGREGLAYMRGDVVDAVVTDIVMPDMDGLEMLMTIRRSGRRMPVVAVSGGVRGENLDLLGLARRMGADAVLSKPFAQDQLLGALAQALAGTGEAASAAGS